MLLLNKTVSLLSVAYNNAMFNMALRFYKMHPTQSMLNRLHVEFIHFGHGIDETNHQLPHTHLWDTLDVETIPLTDNQKLMYIAMMPSDHFEAFMMHGANARYHAHGLEGETVDDEIYRIEQRYYAYQSQSAKRHIAAGIACLLTGLSILTLMRAS